MLDYFRKSRVRRYAFAVGCVFASVLATLPSAPLLQGRAPLFAFTIAVIAAAWFGGIGPGLLATVLSIAVVGLFLIPKVFSFFPVPPGYTLLVLFGVLGVTISAVAENLLRTAARLSEAKDRLQLANEQLRDKQFELQTMAEAMPEILSTSRSDGSADYCSRRFYDYTGMSPGTGNGRGWLLALHAEDREKASAIWQASVRLGTPVEVEYRLRRYDGEYRWFRSHSVPMRDATGKVIKWFGVASDIHELKSLEQELASQREALSRSNEELQRFAYAISHDLRQPLRTIGAHTELLIKRFCGKLDIESDEIASLIVDGVKQMQVLIDGLLEYSKITADQSENKLNTDANLVLSLAVQHLKSAIDESGARITSDPLPTVMANDGRLLQVFQNLIGNAIKYRGSNRPEIHISSKQDGDQCCFSVSDNGIGIDPRYHERIFGVFQRLHTSAEYDGTGIGLALVKRIVERHGGRIWVVSGVGKGSTFYFTLPEQPEG